MWAGGREGRQDGGRAREGGRGEERGRGGKRELRRDSEQGSGKWRDGDREGEMRPPLAFPLLESLNLLASAAERLRAWRVSRENFTRTIKRGIHHSQIGTRPEGWRHRAFFSDSAVH